MDTKKKAFTAIVSGRVQGVGFRYSTHNFAQRLGLKGYVQNLNDGTVKIVAQGPSDRILQLKTWLKKGPPGSYVRHLSIRDTPVSDLYSRFGIEY